MRPPIRNGVRPLADYEVDRPEVYALQRVEPTGTNRPRTWLCSRSLSVPEHRSEPHLQRCDRSADRSWTVSVTMAEGEHPVPSRTRKLSPPAPMVLPGQLGGRVGRRRTFSKTGRLRAACFRCGA